MVLNESIAGMEFSSFFQGIVEHWAAEALLILGGVVFAFLRKKVSWAPIAAYALGGVVGVAVLFFTLTGHGVFAPAPASESNIEDHVKEWCTHYGFGIQSASQMPANTDFAYNITSSNGYPVTVSREVKNRPGYLQFTSTLTISPEHLKSLSQMSNEQAVRLFTETESEALRHDIGFLPDNSDPRQVRVITLNEAVPISTLTQASFGSAIDQLTSTIALTRNQFVLAIQDFGGEQTPPLKKASRQM